MSANEALMARHSEEGTHVWETIITHHDRKPHTLFVVRCKCGAQMKADIPGRHNAPPASLQAVIDIFTQRERAA
jgi:hypothetical protein